MTIALLAAALLAIPAAAPDRSEDEVRAQIAAYLGSIDTPIRAEQWQSLGPKAQPILTEIAQDQGKLPTRRARALEGLSLVGHDAEAQLMVAMAQNESEHAVVRMSALRGAGRLMAPQKLLAALQPVLASAKNTHVRAAAAEVLAHRAPSGGCASVADQLTREPSDKRLAFRHAMKACNLDQAPAAK